MSCRTKVLIVGRSGQLSRALAASAFDNPELELFFIGRPDLDITDYGSCQKALAAILPDVVINPAAYTNVDGATLHPGEAEAVNTQGAANLGLATAAHGVPIIHISTDYVFDGSSECAYRETDQTNPINTYGMTKLCGEQAVANANPLHLILRVAWLYSPFGPNFVTWLLNKASEREASLSMVTDQIGNPTCARALSKSLVELIRKAHPAQWRKIAGLYHLAGPDSVSRYTWAKQVLQQSKWHSGPSCTVAKALTADFPTPALRPLATALDTTKISRLLGIQMPSLRDSLSTTVRDILLTKEPAL